MKVLNSEEREESILNAGAQLAAKYGAVNVTRRMVASKLKISDGLVSHYMGGTAEAQAAYKKRMKKLKLVEPAKDKIEALGVKLRAKGPREVKSTRKRSIKEVKAIKRNVEARTGKSTLIAAAKRAGIKVISAKTAGKKINGKKVTGVIVDEVHTINRTVNLAADKPKRVRPSRAKPKPAPPENKVIPAAPANKAARLPKAPPPGLDATA